MKSLVSVPPFPFPELWSECAGPAAKLGPEGTRRGLFARDLFSWTIEQKQGGVLFLSVPHLTKSLKML